jgi:hypothetical protein
MIKVIVVVTGLALVEAPTNGPIDIHLPETEGFYNPVPLLLGGGPPKAFAVDRHEIELRYGDKKAKVKTTGAPDDLRIILGVPGSAPPDLTVLDSLTYVSFDETLPAQRSTVRAECRFSATDPFDDCEAIDAKGGKRGLLAGQIRLAGPWRAVLPSSLGGLYHQGRNHELRLFVDDEKRSTTLGSPVRNFVDTFFFETEVESVDRIAIEDSLFARRVRLYDPGEDVCKHFDAAECRMLWVENSPYCGWGDPRRPCAEVSEFLRRADTHLAQLYRLTSTYEPNAGIIVDPLYTLIGTVEHAHRYPKATPAGNGSPKCYGGYISP